MEGIDNNYIENAINTLDSTIGIKEHVDDQKIISLINSNKIREAIKEIAIYLGLPIEINLSYVPVGYRADSTNKFDSQQLVKTDWRGRSNEGITAQVSIPGHLPLYGSSELNNFTINIRVSENCKDNADTLIAVMAHELSHVVLYCLSHNEKENEIYTDIAAMMLGFSVITKRGRKVVKTTSTFETTRTHTTTYGYLSDKQFDFSYNKIEQILNKYRARKEELIKKVKKLEKKIKNEKVIPAYFNKYLEYLDKNLNQKISQVDGNWISSFHQTGYIDEFESAVRMTERELKLCNAFAINLNHYSDNILQKIKKYEENNRAVGNDLDSKFNKINGAVVILKRYIPVTYRLKTFFELRLLQNRQSQI